jgi:NAD-dependent deacetylase
VAQHPCEDFEIATQWLREAQSIFFVTGAGISADSGLPTYRGIGGLYEETDGEEGLPIEVLLSGQTFRRDPALTWKYIRQIEEACRGAKPNHAHLAIADLERGGRRVWTLTQNVDGLHRAAGSEQVIDIHGDVHSLRCTRCSWNTRVSDYAALPACPRCPSCDAVIRPEVVLFGEMLPGEALRVYERELAEGFELFVSIGTSSLFPYIASPMVLASQAGLRTIEINPGDTPISDTVGIHLREGAAAALRRLWHLD